MMLRNNDPDYLNEQYFEDWGADPSVALTRNGTDGRVYGGDCNLIHVVDGNRAALGREMAATLDTRMRQQAVGRTAEQRETQLLCPGCYMVVVFDMLTELARRNGQPLTELASSMCNALEMYASKGISAIEEIEVILDPE
jgi:hypothetical protein